MLGWGCSSVDRVLAKLVQSPKFYLQHIKPGMVVEACNLNNGELNAEGSEVQGHQLKVKSACYQV